MLIGACPVRITELIKHLRRGLQKLLDSGSDLTRGHERIGASRHQIRTVWRSFSEQITTQPNKPSTRRAGAAYIIGILSDYVANNNRSKVRVRRQQEKSSKSGRIPSQRQSSREVEGVGDCERRIPSNFDARRSAATVRWPVAAAGRLGSLDLGCWRLYCAVGVPLRAVFTRPDK
jgi:hypothetical protein